MFNKHQPTKLETMQLSDDINQPKEQARWTDTLAALDSIKAGYEVDEKEVNDWLNSYAEGKKAIPPAIAQYIKPWKLKINNSTQATKTKKPALADC